MFVIFEKPVMKVLFWVIAIGCIIYGIFSNDNDEKEWYIRNYSGIISRILCMYTYDILEYEFYTLFVLYYRVLYKGRI